MKVITSQIYDFNFGKWYKVSLNKKKPFHIIEKAFFYLFQYRRILGCDKNFDECPKFTLNSPLTFSLTSQLKFFSSNQ
jgi:hypothetical protein